MLRFWYGVRMIFPHAFENTFFIVIFGTPVLLTMLVTKIKPEGKTSICISLTLQNTIF